MKNRMALLCISLIYSQHCFCSTLSEYDSPYLFTEMTDGRINGYYGLSLPNVGERPSASCEFFFSSDRLENSSHGAVAVRTFYSTGLFDKRQSDTVLTGEILLHENQLTLQMDQVPYGCLSAAGGGFLKGASVPNGVTKRTTIIGIFVVNRKTSFYDKKGYHFLKKGLL